MLLCCCCLCFCCCWLSLFRCCCFPPFCLPPAYKSSLAASCAHFWTLSIAASSHAPHQWCPPCINIRFFPPPAIHTNYSTFFKISPLIPSYQYQCIGWSNHDFTYHNCARKFNTTYKLEPLVYAIFSDVHIIWSPMPLPTDTRCSYIR